MSQTLSELLILILVALGTGYLMFIAGVIQGTMEDMKELELKAYLTSLYKSGASCAGPTPFALC